MENQGQVMFQVGGISTERRYTQRKWPLIGPEDPDPVVSFNDGGTAPVLVVADHAGRAFPAAMKQLGLADYVLDRHVAWDIGSGSVARRLAERLDAPAVLSVYSRLIVDPNRQLDDPSAFIEVSDGIAIPGNLYLSEEQKQLRTRSFFEPYHNAIDAALARFCERGITPVLLSIHSCTPVFDRLVRPWQLGVLWDRDPRLPVPLIERLRGVPGVHVGDNEPYSGRHPQDYTIDAHAEPAGLPYAGIEVRQDLIDTKHGACYWADLLATALLDILADPTLYTPFPSGSEQKYSM